MSFQPRVREYEGKCHMEESSTDYSKILEMKMRWQLREVTDESVTRNMQHYISQIQQQENPSWQEDDLTSYEQVAPVELDIESYRQELELCRIKETVEKIKEVPEIKPQEPENMEYKTSRIGYEAYRQILNDKEEEQKAFSLDRKG